MYPDLSTRHDWPVKNAIVNLPIREKRNLKRISGNSLRPLRAQNKDISAALWTLLTGVKVLGLVETTLFEKFISQISRKNFGK